MAIAGFIVLGLGVLLVLRRGFTGWLQLQPDRPDPLLVHRIDARIPRRRAHVQPQARADRTGPHRDRCRAADSGPVGRAQSGSLDRSERRSARPTNPVDPRHVIFGSVRLMRSSHDRHVAVTTPLEAVEGTVQRNSERQAWIDNLRVMIIAGVIGATSASSMRWTSAGTRRSEREHGRQSGPGRGNVARVHGRCQEGVTSVRRSGRTQLITTAPEHRSATRNGPRWALPHDCPDTQTTRRQSGNGGE
jgi:hypothetical protein